MSLLMLSIEYLLLHTIFETIRTKDEKESERKDLNSKQISEILSTWNPLSDNEWKNIKNLNGGYM